MIRTERLVLRPVREADRPALRAMLTDPVVMEDLTRDPSVESADASIERHIGYREEQGLGFWVVEHDGAVAGFCGLKRGDENTPIAGELEVGWIFASPWWGRGFAREAAEASLTWGWANSDTARIVAITSACNQRSQALMARLGMRHVGGFDSPRYPEGDRLRPSVIYAIDRPA